MDQSTRAAVVARYAAIAGPGSVVPHSWEEINNIALQLEIESQDPELAQVLKGKMSAALEHEVLTGEWSIEPPAKRDLQAEHEAAIESALAGLTIKGIDQVEADHRAQRAQHETARLNSLRMVGQA